VEGLELPEPGVPIFGIGPVTEIAPGPGDTLATLEAGNRTPTLRTLLRVESS
jgi:hypothetical protein